MPSIAKLKKWGRFPRLVVSESLPAPIGGLNARDSIALMPETDAIIMDNLFPQSTSVDIRSGRDTFATFSGNCESICVYKGLTAQEIFVGVVNGSTRSLYNATNGGALTTPVVGGAGNTVQALTSTRFDYINFGTPGGQFLFLVNGVNTGLQYNGTAWTAWTVTGVATSSIFTLAAYGSRLWLGQKDSFNVWYLDTNAITGTATQLNLGSLFSEGGSLSNIVTITADSASELATHIAFVSTEGEVVVYTGDNPADDAVWRRVADVVIGRPVTKGNRAWCKFSSDAVIITSDGAFPLTQAILTARSDTRYAVTDKIRDFINRDVKQHGARYGWNICLHPAGTKMLINVPTLELSTSYQWVMNSNTKAWCRFLGWNAFCMAVIGDRLFYGGSGGLVRADYGAEDDGSPISFVGQQAYSYFKRRGVEKQFTRVRPVISIDGPMNLGIDLGVDFSVPAPTSVVPIGMGAGDPFGGIWNAIWGGATNVARSWNTARGVGYCAAPGIRGQAKDVAFKWMATDAQFTMGGP